MVHCAGWTVQHPQSILREALLTTLALAFRSKPPQRYPEEKLTIGKERESSRGREGSRKKEQEEEREGTDAPGNFIIAIF